MRRNEYVDEQGNPIDYSFTSKKPILNLFFIIGTILPLVLVGFIIYTVVNNNYCHEIYGNIETATYNYLNEEKKLPEYSGDHIYVKLDDLYEHSYLTPGKTANTRATGRVKVTKVEDDYIYTLDVNNCDKCSVSKRYQNWSGETSSYDSSKTIVDVVPYYNLYDREVNTTEWSDYYDQENIKKKTSKYGVRMPKDQSQLPNVPEGTNIVEVQKEDKTFYRYSDKSWKWYDIVSNYSDFYSEQPSGYQHKDANTEKNTEYTEWSLNYPEEHDYRTIRRTTGYKYYYVDDNGQKVYTNNGKYTVEGEVDLDVYTERDEEGATMYSYSDKVWRWYNGTRRNYSGYMHEQPSGRPYRDDGLYILGNYSSWDEDSLLTHENESYRVEETKIMSRYRYVYETLSLPLYEEALTKAEFEEATGRSLEDIRQDENYKVEVTYKFKYRDAM